jgi:hypothetical protein
VTNNPGVDQQFFELLFILLLFALFLHNKVFLISICYLYLISDSLNLLTL